MKRLFTAVVTALFMILQFQSGFAQTLSADEQAYLRSKGTIVFVSQTRYPPFGFVDKN